MLKWLFGRKPPESKELSLADLLPGMMALAYGNVCGNLPQLVQHERGIHAESWIVLAGGLCGFQAHQTGLTLLETDSSDKVQRWRDQVGVVQTTQGPFVLAEIVNQLLFGDAVGCLGVFTLVQGRARNLGATIMPDPLDLLRANAAALGDPHYPPFSDTMFRFPDGYLDQLMRVGWQALDRFFAQPQYASIDAVGRMTVMALAVGDAIEQCRSMIAPDVTLRAALEAAVAMSKIMTLRPAYIAEHPRLGPVRLSFADA